MMEIILCENSVGRFIEGFVLGAILFIVISIKKELKKK